jgi:hypothetical protein
MAKCDSPCGFFVYNGLIFSIGEHTDDNGADDLCWINQGQDYALDASTIDLCLSLFPWASFRKTKAAVKLHAMIDLQGNIPEFIHITNGKVHAVALCCITVVVVIAHQATDRPISTDRASTVAGSNATIVVPRT